MITKIFFTTNAGLYFCSDTSEVLIDGIHNAGAAGFDAMPAQMIRQMKSEQGLFIGSGTLLFTHLHPDHYDAGKVNKYLETHPEVSLWGPGLDIRGISNVQEAGRKGDTCGEHETGSSWSFDCGDLHVNAYSTMHSGAEFAETPHYSFLISNTGCGETFFIAGDAVLEPELAAQIRKDICEGTVFDANDRRQCSKKESEDRKNESANGNIDSCKINAIAEEDSKKYPGIAAFVMVYQLMEESSREFLKELTPSRVFMIHQPLPGEAAYDSIEPLMDYPELKLPGGVVIEKPDPMSWIR